MNLSGIKSPLEKAHERGEVEVGSQIVYRDVVNYDEYEVVAVDATHFSAVSVTDVSHVVTQAFESTQYGWKLL